MSRPAALLAVLGCLLGALPAWGQPRQRPASPASPAPPQAAVPPEYQGATPSMIPFLDLAACIAWDEARAELKGKREMFEKQIGNPDLAKQIETFFALGPCPRRPRP